MKGLCLLLLTATLVVSNVGACSYPQPPTFAESLEKASDVFVFRLLATKLIRHEEGNTYAEWIEGSINPVMRLKGNGSYERIAFSTRLCGGIILDTGHYFLVATDQSGPDIQLRSDDASILNITREFSEDFPEANVHSRLLDEVKKALSGEIDPTSIRTWPYSHSIVPPPPEPPRVPPPAFK